MDSANLRDIILYRNKAYQTETSWYLSKLEPAVAATHALLGRDRDDIKWTDATATDTDVTIIGYLLRDFDDYIAIFQGRRILIEIPLHLIDGPDAEKQVSIHLNTLYGEQLKTYNDAKAQAITNPEEIDVVTEDQLAQMFGEELDTHDDLGSDDTEEKPTLH